MQSVQFSGSVAFQEPSTDGAPGIWELEDALRNQALGKWPTIPATVPDWLKRGPDGALPVDHADYALGKGWFNGQPYPNLFAYMDAAGGAFSRGSDATYFDASGILRTAGPNVLRLDHDPASGEPLGVRAEGSRTNLIPWSENLGSSYFEKGGLVVSIGSVPSPNGSFMWLASGIGQASRIGVPPSGQRDGNIYSAWYAADGSAFVGMSHLNARGLEEIGTGVHRVVRGFQSTDSNADRTYVLDTRGPATARNVHSWGYQVEAGTFASSYIPTSGSAATRLPDSLSIDRAGTPEGTVVVEAVSPPGDSGVTGNDVNGLFEWNDGSGSNRISVYRRASNRMYMELNVGSPVSVITAPISPTPVGNATRFRVAFSWKEGQLAASLNGEAAAVATGYAGPMPTTSKIYIGCRRANNPAYAWFGTIARLAIFDRAYTPSQLQEMSA